MDTSEYTVECCYPIGLAQIELHEPICSSSFTTRGGICRDSVRHMAPGSLQRCDRWSLSNEMSAADAAKEVAKFLREWPDTNRGEPFTITIMKEKSVVPSTKGTIGEACK